MSDPYTLPSASRQSEWGSTPVFALSHKAAKIKSTPAKPPVHPACGHDHNTCGTDHAPVGPNDDMLDVTVRDKVIHVKKESLEVFSQMYRAESECLAGGTICIRWQAFVQAMKDAGFAASESSGSAVTFRDQTGQSISFHRPHPKPILDHVMLYGMAKRMTKWFGFNAERFALREKISDEGRT